jgi:hypothetical protein
MIPTARVRGGAVAGLSARQANIGDTSLGDSTPDGSCVGRFF